MDAAVVQVSKPVVITRHEETVIHILLDRQSSRDNARSIHSVMSSWLPFFDWISWKQSHEMSEKIPWEGEFTLDTFDS